MNKQVLSSICLWLADEADHEPRTTLFVLRYLDRFTRDSGLKKEIAETKQYVQQQYAKYKAGMQK